MRPRTLMRQLTWRLSIAETGVARSMPAQARRQRRFSASSTPGRPTPGTPADAGPDADPEEVARAILLRALTAAPKSRAQLAELLASRGVPVEVAEASLDRFEELRLIDDAEFARMWVRSRHEHRGLSRRALRYELTGRGVARQDIEEALTLVDDEDELRAATALARRKSSTVTGLPADVQRRRIMAALQRKGYSAGLASRVVSVVLAGAEDMSEDAY